jgi:hypothetical protein
MPQVFPEVTNLLSRASIVGVLLGLPALALVSWGVYRSPWVTCAGMPLEQPVPFSHKHHVSDDGIDCRFCHTSVETSGFAGIPPTRTCMTCHSLVWNRAAVLEPVRAFVRASWSASRGRAGADGPPPAPRSGFPVWTGSRGRSSVDVEMAYAAGLYPEQRDNVDIPLPRDAGVLDRPKSPRGALRHPGWLAALALVAAVALRLTRAHARARGRAAS